MNNSHSFIPWKFHFILFILRKSDWSSICTTEL